MSKKDVYTTDGECAVFCGKTEVARAYVGDDGYEVRVLQGMPRHEVMDKIRKDCPEFLLANGVPDNYHPKLFSALRRAKR